MYHGNSMQGNPKKVKYEAMRVRPKSQCWRYLEYGMSDKENWEVIQWGKT